MTSVIPNTSTRTIRKTGSRETRWDFSPGPAVIGFHYELPRAAGLPGVLKQPAVAGLRHVDDPIAIDCHAFPPAGLRRIDGIGIGHEVPDLAVADIADADASLDGRIHVRDIRLRVGAVEQPQVI